ncbi:MAG: cupin domain-containing protein [Bacteroidota bacterium]|nr:cupin domain-containing protein [Bacteroidota bacterium]MDX5449202.1 cupin domain-containing protein [Bacteroidota bacterium]
MEKVNIQDKFSLFKDHWNPRVVAELNGQMVKLARLKGPFVWHSHQDEDELFFVIQGTLQLEFRDRTIALEQGEMMVIPRGTEHRPVAEEEVLVMLFEPASTLNTGDLEVEGLTRDELDHI